MTPGNPRVKQRPRELGGTAGWRLAWWCTGWRPGAQEPWGGGAAGSGGAGEARVKRSLGEEPEEGPGSQEAGLRPSRISLAVRERGNPPEMGPGRKVGWE